jgi:hypothetical protein
MDKIYLRLRKNVMILLDDGLWTLVVGDMIVLQKIGQKLKEIKHSKTLNILKKIVITTSIEYSTY